MAYSMTYDEDSVSLVGERNITLKVPNPKYVMRHTWPFIKDRREVDTFWFHFSVARALQFHEIEHSEKGPCRVVIQDHPDPKYQVVLSYDETAVRLETLCQKYGFVTRFPHFVMEHLIVKLQNKDPQQTLRIFHDEALDAQYLYHFPDSSIVWRYFKDYEIPEDELDDSEDDAYPENNEYPEDDLGSEDDEYPENNETEPEPAAPDPFAGLKAAGFVQVRADRPCACAYCSPRVPAAPVPAPAVRVPEPVKKSFWSRVCSWLRR